MSEGKAVPSGRARARRMGRGVLSSLVPLAGFVVAVLGVQSADARVEAGQGGLVAGAAEARVLVAGWCVLVVVVLVAMRRRHAIPFATALIVMEGLLPLGPVAAFALPVALVRGTLRQSALLVSGHAVATVVWAWLDLQGQSATTSVIRTIFAPPDGPTTSPVDSGVTISIIQVVLLVLSTVVLPAALGFRLRQQQRLDRVESRARAHEIRYGQLEHELASRQERERIAREIHDVLGHRLSLLSIHAGALELNTEDQGTRASAALVRESAHGAMEDVRSLIGVLREPSGETSQRPAPTLADIQALLDEAVDSGSPIVATVILDALESADPTMSQAGYRIVQELLTNARRHAAGATTRLVITGNPRHGLCIESVNPVGGRPEARAGDRTDRPRDVGSGLTGIQERAALLGGEMTFGTDGSGAFRTSVWIPWVPRDAGSPEGGR